MAGSGRETPPTGCEGKKRKRGGGATTKPAPASVDTTAWPEWLRTLEATHSALNVVYTFCCTRRHLLTTFETLRGAVEAQTGRQLHEADVAAIAWLLEQGAGRRGIRFEYVDELSLQLDVQGTEREEVFKTGAHRDWITAQGPASDASVGGLTGRARLGEGGEDRREVLFFAFEDEDLKRRRPDKSSEGRRLRLPVYGQKQMTELIEKRRRRFAAAATVFLARCAAEGQEAEAALREAAAACMPQEASERNDTDDAPHGTLAEHDDSGIPPEIPTERESIADILDALRRQPWYEDQIVPGGHQVQPARAARYGDLDFLLSQTVVNALYNAQGITQFYAHQAAALNGLVAGRHVVVSTATSSGKSLIYQVPVLRALEHERVARALFMFPTKALAQDQRRSLGGLLAYMGLGDADELVATFDGDTPLDARDAVRERARVILTNADTLHAAVLPQAARWTGFLAALRLVVVDELHYYQGVLGAHVAYVLRRLRRLCAAVGNEDVQFVACSATVAQPGAHFAALVGVDAGDVLAVDGADDSAADGAPTGDRHVVCWNTPLRVAGDASSGRGHALDETARLFCELVLRGVKTVAFCRVRVQSEQLVAAIRTRLRAHGRPAAAERVMAYRGGYAAAARRQLEADMFGGRLLGIVATSALELGVDVGALDAVLACGFPYSLASWRQQAGRAGRRGRDCLAVLVGDAAPPDQHYMQHPADLVARPLDALRLDLDALLVREAHVQCAAAERAIAPAADARFLGAGLQALCVDHLVRDTVTGHYVCHPRYRPRPWQRIALRGGPAPADDVDEPPPFAVVDVGPQEPVVLEEVEADRAIFSLYDGAIYLHQGQQYLVRDVDVTRRLARVERVHVGWTTRQRDFTDVDPLRVEVVRRFGGQVTDTEATDDTSHTTPVPAYLGRIRITTVVFGFFKVDARGRLLDAVHVDTPPLVRERRGTWLDVPPAALALLARRRLHAAAALHAAEHALLGLLPALVALSGPADVRTECKSHLKEFQRRSATRRQRPARLVLYDAANSAGCAARAFDLVHLLLPQALARVEGCVCTRTDQRGVQNPRGCAECVVWPQCVEANTVISRAGAIVVLRALLGLPIDEEALPMGPEPGIPEGPETIVAAAPVPGVREVDAAEAMKQEEDD